MSQSPAATTSSSPTDHEAVIREIAHTNQISLPWDELRQILQDQLANVLGSDQLVYTAPTVTNPLTTTTAPVSGASITQAGSSHFGLLNLPGPTPLTFTTTPATDETAGQKDEKDNHHVPEQETTRDEELTSTKNTESMQERSQKDTESNTTTSSVKETENEAQGLYQTQETKKDGEEEEKKKSEDAASVAQEESEITPSPSSPASTSSEGAASEENVNGIKDVSVAGEQTGNKGPTVLISKDTLTLETPEGYHDRIKGLLNTFTSAPFTIQRVCELLSNPTEHHSNLIKYLRAVEKVLMITSSINEFSNPAYNGPSALDEANNDATKEANRKVNGGYSRAQDLDFSPITTSMHGSEEEEEEEDEFLSSSEDEALVDEDVDVTRSYDTQHDTERGSPEEGNEAQQPTATKHHEEVSHGGIGSDMDVDPPLSSNSPSEAANSHWEQQQQNRGLQPEESKIDNPMDQEDMAPTPTIDPSLYSGSLLSLIILILDLIAVVQVLNSDRPVLHKVLWCLLIFLCPIVGIIIY
ncbi:hypothetical protein BGZ83_006646 [Gryganskiella cystojenkinii]|nr:hypothetical protein BGZ83_006646 [Gryganskiella cystojenkinii]